MGAETTPESLSAADDAGSRSLRILAVGNLYPPQFVGGYELPWQQAMRHARALGHQVRVLTTNYRRDPQLEEEDPDVHRTLRWYWDLERYEFNRPSLPGLIRLERHNSAELLGHLDEFRPDVVAWWSMGCMSLSLIEQVRRRGVPAVFVVHDDWLVYGWEHDRWTRTWTGPRRSRFAGVAERLWRIPARVDVDHAGRFVFISRYTLEQARAVRLKNGAVTTVVHSGIDKRFQEPVEPDQWRGRLLYVGRIDRQKGIDTAVEALAHLSPETTLDIWGSGDEGYTAELQALAKLLGAGDRVKFRGFANPDQVRSVYAEADAVVFPVRWKEPFGLVPLEAMGLGRPLVATARGGTAEFVRDGDNALVFEADDAAGLADCVKRLAADAALRDRLRSGGLQTAARYTIETFARSTVAEIVRAAGSRPG